MATNRPVHLTGCRAEIVPECCVTSHSVEIVLVFGHIEKWRLRSDAVAEIL